MELADLADDRRAALGVLQERLGYTFEDPRLLDRALTHTSYTNELSGGSRAHNEPLEFLGDAVLGFLVADLLHRASPEGAEGDKTKTRAHLVSAPSLATRAEALGLASLMRLGRGEEKTGGREKAKLWADAYEAVVAAIYLDGGVEAAHRFVAAQFASDVASAASLRSRDHKSALQELLQGRGVPPPDYVLVGEQGPSHRRRFLVRCDVGGRPVAEGTGYSKKQAQQEAARLALEALGT
jgi:ribonuclease-3